MPPSQCSPPDHSAESLLHDGRVLQPERVLPGRRAEHVLDVAEADERRRLLVEFLYFHLGDEHCEAVADGCAMRALTADVSRAVALVAPAMPGEPDDQKQRAWAVGAAIVGAVSIARALPDPAHGRAVREATLRSVQAVITQS